MQPRQDRAGQRPWARAAPRETGSAAFTLIELLVVISIIAVIVGLVFPRESSRRLKCLTNLKGLGTGLAAYMVDSDGVLPYVMPLHGDHKKSDESLLDVLADYVAAPKPRQDDDGVHWIVTDPYKCPSDRVGKDERTGFEPLWRTNGTSYEYFAGALMWAAELFLPDKKPYEKHVTLLYETKPDWPVITDADDWHPGKGDRGTGKNAVYYKSWSADWYREPENFGLTP